MHGQRDLSSDPVSSSDDLLDGRGGHFVVDDNVRCFLEVDTARFGGVQENHLNITGFELVDGTLSRLCVSLDVYTIDTTRL